MSTYTRGRNAPKNCYNCNEQLREEGVCGILGWDAHVPWSWSEL